MCTLLRKFYCFFCENSSELTHLLRSIYFKCFRVFFSVSVLLNNLGSFFAHFFFCFVQSLSDVINLLFKSSFFTLLLAFYEAKMKIDYEHFGFFPCLLHKWIAYVTVTAKKMSFNEIEELFFLSFSNQNFQMKRILYANSHLNKKQPKINSSNYEPGSELVFVV